MVATKTYALAQAGGTDSRLDAPKCGVEPTSPVSGRETTSCEASALPPPDAGASQGGDVSGTWREEASRHVLATHVGEMDAWLRSLDQVIDLHQGDSPTGYALGRLRGSIASSQTSLRQQAALLKRGR